MWAIEIVNAVCAWNSTSIIIRVIIIVIRVISVVGSAKALHVSMHILAKFHKSNFTVFKFAKGSITLPTVRHLESV